MFQRRAFALYLLIVLATLGSVADRGFAIVFTDVTVSAGLNYTQWQLPVTDTDLVHHMTGGAAAGDFDNDGLIDLFVTRLNNTDLLYRNLGNGTFQDVSSIAGFNQSLYSNGGTWGDIDNDGDLDLYVTTTLDFSLRNYLYINNGNGTFVEDAVARGADLSTQALSKGFSSTFGDYDHDGFLDLFTVEWNSDTGAGNSRLLRNLGSANPGSFEDVTFTAGVDLSVGNPIGNSYGFAPTFSDMDRDGHVDLVVAGDFGQSRLFWNNGDGTFTNGTNSAFVGTDENGMGSALADYDGDGDLDWFVSSIYEAGGSCGGLPICGWGDTGNRLYENQGNRIFTDVTDSAGVREGGWGWGAEFLDYDNDGDLDLTHTNGVDLPGEPRAEIFVNDQTRFWENINGVFSDVATQVGITDDGSGKGLLTFDFDGDGDLDVFIVNNAGQPILYRNEGGNANDWLRIRAIGTASNADGVGGQVTVELDTNEPDNILYDEISAGSNYLGQSELVTHFGLGDFAGTIDRVTVVWPTTGIVQVLEDVDPNQLLTITEPMSADWNQDGVVDTLDYAVWNANLGMTSGAAHTDGDSDHDGDVDGADLLKWQRQFGSTALAASHAAVPEPSTCGLLGIAIPLLTRLLHRNRD